MPLEGRTPLSDKEIHAVVYLGLALLAYRAAMMVPLKRAFDPIAQSLMISSLYGILDEIHQLFVPGRHSDVRDWLADVTGTLIAVSAIVLVRTFAGNGGTRSVQEEERQ